MTNLTSGGTIEQMSALCEAGIDEKGEGGALKAMCDLLGQRDEKTVVVILEGIGNILAAAKKHDVIDTLAMKIEECDGKTFLYWKFGRANFESYFLFRLGQTGELADSRERRRLQEGSEDHRNVLHRWGK